VVLKFPSLVRFWGHVFDFSSFNLLPAEEFAGIA